jgi:hypothetical protein
MSGNAASSIGEGLMASMGVMELVAYVQSAWRLEVKGEVIPETFDSINRIVAIVRHEQVQAILGRLSSALDISKPKSEGR